MFEANTARQSDSMSNIEYKEDQDSSFPVEKLPLLLCVLSLSALAGGSTAWIVIQVISVLRT